MKPATKPAREIIDNCIKARGGAEALRRHTSFHLSGTYAVPGAKGFTNRVDIFLAPTNRFSFIMPVPKGLYREGCDGEHYWKADVGNIRFLSGSELEQKLNELQFLSDLYAPESFRSLKTLGAIRLDGHECYQVLLVRTNGEMFDEFYDVETGLLRARHTNDERTGGVVKLLATFDNYRRFGDWMMSTRDSYRLFGAPQELTVTKAEWDTVPDAVFAMPARGQSCLEEEISGGCAIGEAHGPLPSGVHDLPRSSRREEALTRLPVSKVWASSRRRLRRGVVF